MRKTRRYGRADRFMNGISDFWNRKTSPSMNRHHSQQPESVARRESKQAQMRPRSFHPYILPPDASCGIFECREYTTTCY
jgi:hypothetical protein